MVPLLKIMLLLGVPFFKVILRKMLGEFLTNYRARVSSLRCDVRGLVFRQRLLLLETAEGEQSPGSQLPLPLEWRENTTLTSL